ncbi:MAG: alpha/beta hydrolase-fold protein [Ignavibacteria bacterium]
MHREIHKWWSTSLNKDMEIAAYGHYGFVLLMFPASTDDYLEYERFGLIEDISPFINEGKVKVYSVNCINKESWLNENMQPAHKAIRHQQYNEYIIEEVVPFISQHSTSLVPIITSGASLGALHAANSFFRKPNIFAGTIAMSGNYDLKTYTNGYYDDNCYFNSPVDYLPHWEDHHIIKLLKQKSIIIASGQGDHENPDASKRLSEILNSKKIPHWLDLWGPDMKHDWSTWKEMLPYFLGKINF